MKDRMILLFLMLFFSVLLSEAMEIHVSSTASKAEKNAAKELSVSLEKIYGVKFPVVNTGGKEGAFYVGHSPEAAERLGNLDFSSLKSDEIIIRTCGKDMVVTGGKPRGILYAVYELLERGFGVRYWTPEVSFFPQRRNFSAPELNLRYAPPFECREIHNESIIHHPLFAVKMRNNGHFPAIPEEWGGHIRTLGWCHTFRQMIPASQYFQKHPEYFAERQGKRIPDGQPCLSNPNFRRELIRKSEEWLKRNPGVEKLALSQNDNDLYCECAACSGFVKRHGNQTDLLLDTVNEVIRELKKQYPAIQVETLAYLYTRKPPETVHPHADITIRLCSIECNIAQPLTAASNKSFYDDLKAWRKVTSNLCLWNYITNFSKFYQPHPNWNNLAPDLRFFASSGVKTVFEQSSFLAGGIADLTDLRIWLVSKLLWDPSQDTGTLILEFLNGYYGEAAPEIGRYIELMNRSLKRHPDTVLTCYAESTQQWLDEDLLLDAYEAMRKASEKTAEKPELAKRVAAAAFPVMLAVLERPSLFAPGGRLSGVDAEKLLERQLLAAKSARTELFAENRKDGNYSAFRTRLEQQLGIYRNDGDKPSFLGDRRWFAKAAVSGRLYKKGVCCFIEPDPASGIENSLRMPTDHNQWAFQLRSLPTMRCTLYAEIRCDGENPSGNAAVIGIYSLSLRKEVFQRKIAASGIAGKHYTMVKLGDFDVGPDLLLYCAPEINSNVKNLWLKRCILVEK